MRNPNNRRAPLSALLLGATLGLGSCTLEPDEVTYDGRDATAPTVDAHPPSDGDPMTVAQDVPEDDTSNSADTASTGEASEAQPTEEPAFELATLGAGCFWCVEAVYDQLDGVLSAESGYMGGHVENPTYEQICTKKSGHVEVVQVRYDPAQITYEEILAWFWQLHDPTTFDRQGPDAGPQYRSVIFTHDEEQARIAKASMEAAQPNFPDPIVTHIRDAERFWVAEGYHQEYYVQNKGARYCRALITPKLKKLGLDY